MSTSPFYRSNEATRRRQRREREAAAAAAPRTAWSAAEWRAMPEPDPESEPARHRTWAYFQTNRYEESAMSTGPNPDAVKMHGNRAAALAPAAVRILNRYSKTLSKIKRLDVPEPTKAKLRDLAKQDANANLEPLRQDWKTTKQNVEDITRQRMQPKPMDAAAEARIGRAWNRIERILDKSPDADRYAIIETQLQRAAADNDETTLRALWEGVPAYLESGERDDRGREQAAKIRDVLIHVAAPEEAARAHKEAAEFARGATRIDTALNQADYALTGDRELEASTAPSQFPGWRETELFSLEAETPDEVKEDTETTLRAMLR